MKNELHQRVIEALEDVKGLDIQSIDLRGKSSVADTFVLCTGNSNRQVKALADNVVEHGKKFSFKPLSSEGRDASEWVLIDYGDICVHVMTPAAREFYDLERLWMYGPSTSEADLLHE